MIYPRRVQDFRKQVAAYKDRPTTAAESRELVKVLVELHLDLWDVVLERQDWGKASTKWFVQFVLPTLVSYAIIGSLLWRFFELK